MMKSLKDQLKTVSKNLATLSKQVDKLSVQVEKATKKPAAKKPVRRKTTTKAAAKKAPARAKKAAPARAKKAASTTAKKAPRGSTVLDSVLDVVKRSRKGVSISTLKQKTNLNPRQLSNALYKLTKKGEIKAVSRGVYAKS